MTLQWQQVEINLAASMDQSTVPFALPQALFQEVRNARVYKTGALGKRPGWVGVAPIANDRLLSVNGAIFTLKPHPPFSLNVGAAIALGSLNNEETRVDYHAGSLGSFSVSEVEVLERKTLMRDVLSGDGHGFPLSSEPSFAVSSDSTIAVVAWAVSVPDYPSFGGLVSHQRQVMAMAIDVRTRAIVTGPTQISTLSGDNTQPLVLLNDSTSIVVIYARPGSTQLRGVIYNTSTRTFGADTTIVSDAAQVTPPFLGIACRFDAREFVGGTGWYLIYRNTTPAVAFAKMTGLTVSSSATIAEDPNGTASSVAIYAESNAGNVWLAWYNSTTGVRAAVRSAASLTTVVVAPTTMDPTPPDEARQMTWAPSTTSASVMTLIWTINGLATLTSSGYGRRLSKYRTLDVLGALGVKISVPDLILLSKGYSGANGYTYAAFLYDASDVQLDITHYEPVNVGGIRSQANQVAFTMMVCDRQNAPAGFASNSWRVAAVWAIGEAGRERQPCSLGAFRDVTIDGVTEQWFMLAPEFDLIELGNTSRIVGRPGVDLCRQRLTSFPPIFGARIGGNVVFSGGVPQLWDGVNLNEYGFHYPPENSLVQETGPLGTALSVGSYETQVVWEYRHATGDVARSLPSVSLSTPAVIGIGILTANDTMSVQFPALGNTRKWIETSGSEGVVGRVYRTEANGTIFYSEGDFTSSSGFVANAVSGAAGFLLTATVTQPDATAILHTEIYTHDGILPNYPPPALAFVHTHRNRLFGIVAENRKQVVFTQQYVQGDLPGWHPDLVIDVPDDAVALATLDEKLLILCKNGVFLISGNGPDDKGLNSDYDQPFRLNSPHGCVKAESVVSFPSGVIYQSPAGFCLLDRSTTITRIGGPVEDVLASFPYAQASAVLEDREWIVWAVTDGPYLDAGTTDGRTICYDWRHNVWSVDQVGYPDEFGPSTTYHTSFAASGGNLFSTIQRDGSQIYKESGSADPGPQWIYTYFRTAMLHLGSNSKYQRARWLTLLGQQKGIHELVITVTTYHHAASTGLSQTFGWTEAQLSAMQDYALKMHLQNQVGAFMQIEVQDRPDPAFPSVYDDSALFVTLLMDIGLKRGTFQASTAAME